MRDPFRIDKISLGGGVMEEFATIACLLVLWGVPGMNWFLVGTLAAGSVFGLTLAHFRRR